MRGSIIGKCKDYTKTNSIRLGSLYDICKEVIEEGIEGDFVETGVWAGGSCMMMAYVLRECGEKRNIYMYDTYEGMTEPDDMDVKFNDDRPFHDKWKSNLTSSGVCKWNYKSEEDVKLNMGRTKYPDSLIHLVKGKVEDTVKKDSHKKIAVLRLDTDFYSSTDHSMKNLYPRLKKGGYLIVDDYNCWKGAKRAVDEYFGKDRPELVMVDKSCVIYKKEY